MGKFWLLLYVQVRFSSHRNGAGSEIEPQIGVESRLFGHLDGLSSARRCIISSFCWPRFFTLAVSGGRMRPQNTSVLNYERVSLNFNGMVHFDHSKAEKLVDKLGHTSGKQARKFVSRQATGYGQYAVDEEINCQASSR